jgi:hypothetical protein
MCYPQATQEDIEKIPRMNDFFIDGKSYINVCESKAQRAILGAIGVV